MLDLVFALVAVRVFALAIAHLVRGLLHPDRFESRQLGVLGEPRVSVLLLNLDLDEKYPR